jgi:hypothetical protein
LELNSSGSSNPSILKVLDYEVQMFLGTRHLLSNSKFGEGRKALIAKNAIVESSLIHTRILADIFLSRSKYPDDIHLQDLGLVNNGESGVLIKSLEDAYGKPKDKNSNCWTINKMLAHPTTLRSESYDYSIVYQTLDSPITALIKHIYSSLSRPIPFHQSEKDVSPNNKV